MAAMDTLVMYTVLVSFLLYSAVLLYVVIVEDSLHWILVTVHRYTASLDSCHCAQVHCFTRYLSLCTGTMLHWILVTVHRYTASLDTCHCAQVH
jgi:hypothetical protein